MKSPLHVLVAYLKTGILRVWNRRHTQGHASYVGIMNSAIC
jgi:hypothetical protein